MLFKPNVKLENEKAGLVIMGLSYASLALKSKKDGNYLVYSICEEATKEKFESEKTFIKLKDSLIYFRVKVNAGAKCKFSYSSDGERFIDVGEEFQAKPGRWKGAKVGIFCTADTKTNDAGYADFDWFRIGKLEK